MSARIIDCTVCRREFPEDMDGKKCPHCVGADGRGPTVSERLNTVCGACGPTSRSKKFGVVLEACPTCKCHTVPRVCKTCRGTGWAYVREKSRPEYDHLTEGAAALLKEVRPPAA